MRRATAYWVAARYSVRKLLTGFINAAFID